MVGRLTWGYEVAAGDEEELHLKRRAEARKGGPSCPYPPECVEGTFQEARRTRGGPGSYRAPADPVAVRGSIGGSAGGRA